MTRRIMLAALAALIAAPALAQPTPAPATAAPAAVEDLVEVALETSLGRIVLALDKGRAPLTTANFLKYVDSHRLDGQNFYRAMKIGDAKDGGGLIQGGITTDARKMLPPVAHEPTTQTGLRNVAGTIAMANAGPGTARSDFFIMTVDVPQFDATVTDPGFAAFGHVVDGMDVVRAIFASPTSPTKGEGVMKGQMLEPQVKITKATRVSR